MDQEDNFIDYRNNDTSMSTEATFPTPTSTVDDTIPPKETVSRDGNGEEEAEDDGLELEVDEDIAALERGEEFEERWETIEEPNSMTQWDDDENLVEIGEGGVGSEEEENGEVTDEEHYDAKDELFGKEDDLDVETRRELEEVKRKILKRHKLALEDRRQSKIADIKKKERIRQYWIKKGGNEDFFNVQNVAQEYVQMGQFMKNAPEFKVLPEEYKKAEEIESFTFEDKFEMIREYKKKQKLEKMLEG